MDPVVSNSSVSPNQQQAVDDFVDLATDKLDSDGLFQWVDSGEVIDVNNALVALGNEFGTEAADAALDRLQEEGLLETFVKELYGQGAGGSVSADNRATIFANVAKYGDAETLATFSRVLSESTNSADSYDRVQEFTDAVGTHATAETKVELIKELADLTTEGESPSYLGAFSVTIEGDTEAAAVARLLGTLDGSHAREALDSLSPEQLDAVVNSSILEETFYSQGVVSTSFDTSVFTKLANTVADNGSIEQRAQVFDTAGRRVDDVGDSEASESISDGLTRILTSDTNGVINELAYDRRFDDGRGLTNYVEQLIENGDTATISSIQVQLLLGNDGQGDHTERFNEVGNDGVARNAGKIGFFSGSVQNAVDNIDASNAQKRALVTDIIGTSSGILSGATGLAFPVAGFAVGAGGEVAKRIVDQALQSPRSTIDDIIIDASIPFDPVTNDVNRTSIAFSEFQDMIDQVENANRRNGD